MAEQPFEDVVSRHEEMGHVGKVTPKRKAGFRAKHEEDVVVAIPGDHFVVTVPEGTFERGQVVRVILCVPKEH